MSETTESFSDSTENSTVPTEVLPKVGNLTSLEDLRALQAGSHIQVVRRSPTLIKGFCGNLVVPDGGTPDVLEEIKSSWGGGSYQLQGKVTSPNGKWAYLHGAIQVDIAGYPRDAGKEYIDGVWRPIARPAPVSVPTFVQSNPSGQSDGGLTGMMGTLLQTALQGAMSNDGPMNLEGLAGLITAVSTIANGQPQRDSFSDLDRSLGLITKLRDNFGNDGPDPEETPSGLGSLGGGSLLEMLAMKLLSGQNPGHPQPPPPPNYGYPQAISSEQQWQMMNGGHAPHGYPPPPHNYPPQQPNWTGAPHRAHVDETPPRRSPGPVPATPPTPTPASPPPPAGSASEPEFEPLTVNDVLADLSERDEESRTQFVDELCQAMGLDKALLSGMFPNGPPNGGAQPAAPPPSMGTSPPFTLDQQFGSKEE